MKPIYRLFTLHILFIGILLTGCFNGQNLSHMKTTVHAVNSLNPNINNHPSPVVVTFYQLKSSIAFQQSNFFSLYNNPSSVLGDDLVDKREIEIRPKQTLVLQQTIANDVAYIGILVAYRNPDRAQWRQVLTVPAKRNLQLIVDLGSQKVHAKIK